MGGGGVKGALAPSEMKNTIVKDCYVLHGYISAGFTKICRGTENVAYAII
jgi:hypothetical protein